MLIIMQNYFTFELASNYIMNERHQLFRERALQLISEKGFKGMTMRDLAAAMQCDVANIYNYIPSKQAFLKDQLFSMSALFHEGLDEITESGLSVSGQIKQLVRLYVRLTFEFPLQVALLANEWRHLESKYLMAFVEERNDYEEKVRKLVSRGIRKKEIRSMNAHTGTHLVLSSLRWLFMHIDHTPVRNRITLEDEIIQFLMNGLSISRVEPL